MMHETDLERTAAATPSPRLDPERLFADYVAICNQAIAENEDKFWYRQALRLNEKLWPNANFRTLIYDEDPGAVVADAVVHFDARRAELRVLSPGDHDIAFSWKAPLAYLEDVVYSRPQWYLDNPLRLDWGWMKERVRDEARYRLDGRSLAAGVALGTLAGILITRRSRRKR